MAVLEGYMPIISFEQANIDGQLLVMIFLALPSPGSEALSLHVFPHSLLQGLIAIDEMINPSFDAIKRKFPSGFVPILWHFQQEVIPQIESYSGAHRWSSPI